MLFSLIRLAVLIGGIYLIYRLVNYYLNRPDPNACKKCQGRGAWDGVRGKEPCNECRGTGKLVH